MSMLNAIDLMLGVAVFGLIVWLLVTFVAKTTPAREIVIAVAVIVLIFVLVHQFAGVLHLGR